MNNKYIIATMLAAIMVLSIVAFVPGALAGKPQSDDGYNGNKAPSGQHYNLNLIGVKGPEDLDHLKNDNNPGHRIFVYLNGRSKIGLGESSDGKMHVVDADATDKDGASFQLPKPYCEEVDILSDSKTPTLPPAKYTVWARAVGKPSDTASAMMTTCATNKTTKEEECSLNTVTLERPKGKQTFSDVTRELTTVTYCTEYEGDVCIGQYRTISLFHDEFENFLWEYDNNGIKVTQLRFYPQDLVCENPV